MASPTRFTHLCAARRISSALPSNGPSCVAPSRTVLVRGGQRPDALEEAERALHLLVGPVEVPLGRAGEEHVDARRVRAVLLHDGGRAPPRCPSACDIFRPSGPLTMPWVTRRVTGSSIGTRPSSFITRRPEAEVEQVHHGVLGAADVDVHRQPALRQLRVERRVVVVRREVARVVPGGVDEGVHRLRLAPRGAAALGTGGVRRTTGTLASGGSPLPVSTAWVSMSGSRTGSWSSGTGMPLRSGSHFSQ